MISDIVEMLLQLLVSHGVMETIGGDGCSGNQMPPQKWIYMKSILGTNKVSDGEKDEEQSNEDTNS